MPANNPEVRRTTSAYATSVRLHGPEASKTVDAKRDLAAARLADYIERVVAQAPPLTDDQRNRLAALLRPL